jgi:protease-4
MMSGGGKKKPDKPAIAIVYVEGPIVVGKPDESPFADAVAASTPIRKALDEAARDDAIKGVVLRVNSPGGSATGSEIILEATRRVKAKKPLVVSMGNVAGSGGYYVACGSDTIFADPSTLTGSIGVVFGKLVTTGMWDKVGINFEPFKRGANADILASSAPFTSEQKAHMQDWMTDIYVVFKDHVTAIRGDKLKKPLDELAGGRVYTGQQALELGLIDKIGSMNDAVAFAAAEAKLSDYDVRIVPEPKNLLEKIFEEAAGAKDESKFLRLGGGASILDVALPHLSAMDPQRVRSVVRALHQLQILQEEGVTLMMPEFLIGR